MSTQWLVSYSSVQQDTAPQGASLCKTLIPDRNCVYGTFRLISSKSDNGSVSFAQAIHRSLPSFFSHEIYFELVLSGDSRTSITVQSPPITKSLAKSNGTLFWWAVLHYSTGQKMSGVMDPEVSS
jgi:hypothetical protein